PGSSFFPQQCLQGAAQQLAQGGGDSLPVADVAVPKSAKGLHEIKGRAVDLDGIHRRTAMKPLAPTAREARGVPRSNNTTRRIMATAHPLDRAVLRTGKRLRPCCGPVRISRSTERIGNLLSVCEAPTATATCRHLALARRSMPYG